VDIVVKGRNVEVPEHFRERVQDKLAPAERLDSRVIRIDVELTHEKNPRQSDRCQRVELTCRTKGPVVRAEANAADFYAALDAAVLKLEARLRKSHDRKRISHGRHTPPSVAEVTASLPSQLDAPLGANGGSHDTAHESVAVLDRPEPLDDTAALVVRDKTHQAGADEHRRRPPRDGAGRTRLLPVLRHRDRPAERRLPSARLRLRRHPARCRLIPPPGGRRATRRDDGARACHAGDPHCPDPSLCARSPRLGRRPLEVSLSEQPPNGVPAPVGTLAVEPIRVLVVDDHALFRRGLQMVLEQEPDIEVVGEASDGAEAVEKAADTLPDIVLMDVRMPKRGGIDACTAIHETVPSAKIIMLTISDEEADLYDAIKAGAMGYLLKEISIEEVASAIRAVHGGQSLISPSMASKLLTEFASMIKKTDDRQQVPPRGSPTARWRSSSSSRRA
jgi:two-component system NarL family response regulator